MEITARQIELIFRKIQVVYRETVIIFHKIKNHSLGNGKHTLRKRMQFVLYFLKAWFLAHGLFEACLPNFSRSLSW